MKRGDYATWSRTLVVLAGLTLAAGCAKQPIIDKAIPTLSRDQVIGELNRNAQATHSVRADLSMKAQMGDMPRPQGCDGDLAAEFPDKLRIKGSHPLLDYEPFDIGSDGQTWFWCSNVPKSEEMHYGSTAALDQRYERAALVKPRDITLALGVGEIKESPNSQIYFTRNPGEYVLTETVTTSEGRYLLKKIFVDPKLMAVSRMETYKPDGGIDMIAEMTFNPKAKSPQVPTGARIRVLGIEKNPMMLDLTLKDRKTGGPFKPQVFAMPDTEGRKNVQQHGGSVTSMEVAPDAGPAPIFK